MRTKNVQQKFNRKRRRKRQTRSDTKTAIGDLKHFGGGESTVTLCNKNINVNILNIIPNKFKKINICKISIKNYKVH